MKHLVVLSGAGMSAESGIKTFRDADGLWEGHDVMQVASPQGWQTDPELVLDFYNQRRRQLFEVEPNAAHRALVKLEQLFEVTIITQNVDDLHERAGSSHVLHLHGQLRSARSEQSAQYRYDWTEDIRLGDTAEDGAQLRPDIVWFGEDVPMMIEAIPAVSRADIVLIIGTSLQVYPAANLYQYAPAGTQIYYLDPNAETARLPSHITCLGDTACSGMRKLLPNLQALSDSR